MTRARAALSGFIAITMLAATHGVDAQAADPYPGFDAYVAKAIQTWKMPTSATRLRKAMR